MAHLRTRKAKDGRTIYHACFWYAGSNRTKSLGKVTKRKAEKLLKAIELDIISGKLNISSNEQHEIWIDKFNEVYDNYSAQMLAPKTARMDRDILQKFKEYVGDIKLKNVNQDDVENYLGHRLTTLAKASVNIELRRLKSVFNRAIEWGYIQSNPASHLKQYKVKQSNVPEYLELDQIAKLREAFKDSRLEGMVEFFLLTGARLREVVYLMSEDIDTKNQVIHFRGSKTKSGRNRSISYGDKPELVTLIERLSLEADMPVFRSSRFPDKPWDPDYIGRRISRTMNELGMPWASVHTLRHTFASHMLIAGVSIYLVSRLLGHHSIRVTEEVYGHLSQKAAARALGELPY